MDEKEEKSNQLNIDKTTAGILAIMVGGLGIHKFYLKRAEWGLIYLMFCWTLIPVLAGIIEGIIYLSMPRDKFELKHIRTIPHKGKGVTCYILIIISAILFICSTQLISDSVFGCIIEIILSLYLLVPLRNLIFKKLKISIPLKISYAITTMVIIGWFVILIVIVTSLPELTILSPGKDITVADTTYEIKGEINKDDYQVFLNDNKLKLSKTDGKYMFKKRAKLKIGKYKFFIRAAAKGKAKEIKSTVNIYRLSPAQIFLKNKVDKLFNQAKNRYTSATTFQQYKSVKAKYNQVIALSKDYFFLSEYRIKARKYIGIINDEIESIRKQAGQGSGTVKTDAGVVPGEMKEIYNSLQHLEEQIYWTYSSYSKDKLQYDAYCVQKWFPTMREYDYLGKKYGTMYFGKDLEKQAGHYLSKYHSLLYELQRHFRNKIIGEDTSYYPLSEIKRDIKEAKAEIDMVLQAKNTSIIHNAFYV